MDATTMPSMHSLLPKLISAFPDISFAASDTFHWSPEKKTVFYGPDDNAPLLFHELGHGLLGHQDYRRDIELINMEVAAWQSATKIANMYGLVLAEDTIQDHLDTYREWMHARSTCPTCEAVGVQSALRTYQCVACGDVWRVNDARLCGLKRFSATKNEIPL